MKAAETMQGEIRRKRSSRKEPLMFALIAILTLTLLGPLMTFSGLPMAGEGSPLRQAGYLLIFALIVFGVRPLEAPERLLAVPLLIVIVLAWCWISLSWSIVPDIAVRRLVLTTIIIWSVFILVHEIGYQQILPALRIALVLTLIANYVAVFGFPDFGVHQYDETYDKALVGDWRGVMQHKNVAGATSALALILFIFDGKRLPAALRYGVIALAAIFLIKSGSRTSIGLCGGALALGLLYQFSDSRYRLVLMPVFALVGLAGALVLNVYNAPWRTDTKSWETFTGRTHIWEMLLKYSSDNRIFGAGFGSFWNAGESSPLYRYSKDWVVTLGSGHNGFLDLLVTIGLPGLVLAVAVLVIWPLAKLLTSRLSHPERGALLFSMLFFCSAHNVTESSLLDRDGIVGVFLMLAIALTLAVTRHRSNEAVARPAGAPATRRTFSVS